MALHHAASGEIVDIRPFAKKSKQSITAGHVKTEHPQRNGGRIRVGDHCFEQADLKTAEREKPGF
jgi:hypothetical protein